MNCYQFKNSISNFVEEDISFTNRKQFEEHLVTCSSCKSLYTSILNTKKTMKSLPQVTVSDQFMYKLRNRILADRNARTQASMKKGFSFKRIPSFVYGFAAALLAVIAVFFILQSQESGTTNHGIPPIVQDRIDQQSAVQPAQNRQITPIQKSSQPSMVAKDSKGQIQSDSSSEDNNNDKNEPDKQNSDFQNQIKTVKKQY